MASFGELLRELREDKKITQKELAQNLLGRSISRFSPDIFKKEISPGRTYGSLISDYQSLSPQQKQALLLILDDMKFRSTVNGL